ncbi:MAG TPA: hypothetical protein VIK61_07940 [Acidimicrobiia bacterium]
MSKTPPVERDSGFGLRLAAISFAALGGRIAYVLAARRHTAAWGDSFVYQNAANLLADGKGFIDPGRYQFFGVVTPSAYRPLYPLYLALWSLVDVRSTLGHRLASCLLGAACVAIVGLAGRHFGRTRAEGNRIGLIAAAAAAVSPSLWLNDAGLLSESAAAVAVAVILLVLMRYWRGPSTWRAGVLGFAVAVAALGRAELVLLFPLLAWPMWRWAGSRAGRDKVMIIGAFAAGGVLLLGPWVGYNLSRFDRPVYLATGLGASMGGGACPAAFYGPKTGYWDSGPGCSVDQAQLAIPKGMDVSTPAGLAAFKKYAGAALKHEPDESVRDQQARDQAVRYIRAHEHRFPVVVAARVGRLWGVFRPKQTADFDGRIEGRGVTPARLAMLWYMILMVVGVPGLVMLWRRRQPVAPFLAIAGACTFAAALTFGVQRYRLPFDVVLPVMAAVGISALLGRGEAQTGGGGMPKVGAA